MGVSIGAALVACQSVPAPHGTLENAREALASAMDRPAIVRHAPAELEQAHQALLRAERAWAKDADDGEVQHLAYIATRRAAIAADVAAQREAEEQLRQATLELGRVRAQAREVAARRSARPPVAEAPASPGIDDEVPLAPQPISRRDAGGTADVPPGDTATLAHELEPLVTTSTGRGLVVHVPPPVFGSGEAVVTAQARDLLNRLATAMRRFPERRLVIEGFTAAQGSDEANLERSRRRAEALRQALAGHGVALVRMEARGFGTAHPVADNGTPAGRRLNERVEVWVSDAQGRVPPR